MGRLQIALGMYALLAIVAWFTLPDQRFRYVTIAVLAFFAIRAWTFHVRSRLRDREEAGKEEHEKAPEE